MCMTQDFILLWKIPHKWPKKVSCDFHDAVRHGAHVISFYYGKSHINGPKMIGTMTAVNHTCDIWYFI